MKSDLMGLNRIINMATLAGACKNNGIDLLKSAKSVAEMIRVMKTPQGIEFCMEKQFPSMEVLAEYESELAAANVFIAGDHTIQNPRLVIAYGGRIEIHASEWHVCEVYATSSAEIVIIASDNAFVSVELHHDSSCEKYVNGSAKVSLHNKQYV